MVQPCDRVEGGGADGIRAVGIAASMWAQDAVAQRLVILHTNDTHSQIDPDDKGRGGVLRRKALVDSVRGVEPNVLLVDAWDAVQGTFYFTLYKGEVEQKMLNALGYDVQILGNHEFDKAAMFADALPKQSAILRMTHLCQSKRKLTSEIGYI
ncbi:MAG: hypothetical protein K1V84_07855 [Muribaculaceae bacterium]